MYSNWNPSCVERERLKQKVLPGWRRSSIIFKIEGDSLTKLQKLDQNGLCGKTQ